MEIKCSCITSVAVFDDSTEHRFSLIKEWQRSGKRAAAIMYNPSKANHIKGDNSVNKCMNRVIEDGYGSIEIVNLFTKMSTDPENLDRNDKVTTSENFRYIEQAVENATIVIVGWGAEGGKIKRDKMVLDLLKKHKSKLRCFGFTESSKKPVHPRNVGEDTPLIIYEID